MTGSINDFLNIEDPVDAEDLKPFHGPFGLHGGLAAALLLHRMRPHVPDGRELVALTTRFLRPIGTGAVITAEPTVSGSVVTSINATTSANGKVGLHASAVFTSPQESDTRLVAPAMPDGITHWKDAEPFSIPPEFSPVAARMEIRPALPVFPYTDAEKPIMCGWIRLRDEVPAVDERLVILADALGPSYLTVLTEPKATPTIEMSVQLSDAALHTEFDRVLVYAETTSADARGWLGERIEVWSADGVHLATAHQVRIVR